MSDTARRWVALAAIAALVLVMLTNRLVGDEFRALAFLGETEVLSSYEYSENGVFSSGGSVAFTPNRGALMYYGTGVLIAVAALAFAIWARRRTR